MKTGKIKQVLDKLAKRIVEIESQPISEEALAARHLGGLPTIRWGILNDRDVAEARRKALHEILEAVGDSGMWGASSVDDAVWNFTKHIIQLAEKKRAHSDFQSAIAEAVKEFSKPSSKWTVDILIYGIESACSGLVFGKIMFLSEDLDRSINIDRQVEDFPRGNQMFARLEVTAIDEQSARERAEIILDEHLMVLNAICIHGVPSQIQVSRSDRTGRSYSAYRTGSSVESLGSIQVYGHNLKRLLLAQELRFHLSKIVGARVSGMLASEETEFNMRVLRGLQFAGAGSVDHHPERSFLMFAIALESVVLGNNKKTEITFQLGTRVAHLIGRGLEGRKTIAKTVNELYSRRSMIVHAGEYGVSRQESDLMHHYCLAALAMLAAAPTFAKFKTDSDLEGWFKDRILDGPNHIEDGDQKTRT